MYGNNLREVETGRTGSWASNTNAPRPRNSAAPQPPAGNGILNTLPPSLFELIKPSLRSVFLPREQFIFQQGETIDHIYFPESAITSELRLLDDGRMVEIAVTGREGAVGLTALFTPSLSASCAQVAHAGTAMRIESVLLRKTARIYPEISRLLYPHLDTYIRQISQKAVCNMYHSVEERLCSWLLTMYDRGGRSALKLTHEQMARTLGVHRPSVTCIALELKKQGVIDYTRGGVAILDRPQLEKIACSCYAELSSVE